MEQLTKIKRNRGLSAQAGMSYVELIVVLSIFATMSAVIIYNYGIFQSKVDVKNLASDIALKIVEAQKASLSGKLPVQTAETPGQWKPSYGVYFNRKNDDKSFLYFTDLNNNSTFDDSDCTGECIEKINITKNNYISSLAVNYKDTKEELDELTIVFKRPNSSAIMSANPSFTDTVSYVEIVTSSPNSPTAKIKIYPSGRIQVN